jgi:hypothetical protein
MGFINNLPALQDLGYKEVSHHQALRYLIRRTHQQIEGKGSLNTAANLSGLPRRSPLEGHDHEQINVRIPARLPRRVRAKKYDLIRLELPRDLVT